MLLQKIVLIFVRTLHKFDEYVFIYKHILIFERVSALLRLCGKKKTKNKYKINENRRREAQKSIIEYHFENEGVKQAASSISPHTRVYYTYLSLGT